MSPLVINLPHIDRPDPPAKGIVADRRLYLGLDEKTVLEHGHGDARFLLASAGGTIAGHDVDRLKLSVVDGRVVQCVDGAKQSAPEDNKESAPDADKQSAPDDDKQSAPDGDKMTRPQGDKSAGKRERK